MNDFVLNIGSREGNDILIAEPEVAEHHAMLYLNDGKVCLDLAPGCSALLNGNAVEGKYWLQDTDVVVIGSQRLNLNLIGLALETQSYNPVTDGPLAFHVDSANDLSDAVEMRHNPWPVIIIAIILVGIGVFFFSKMRSYRLEKQAIEAKAKAAQDSIDAAKMRIDTLTRQLKELENQ